MSNQKEITCIVCPIGCKILVRVEKNKFELLKGNKCKKGIDYAKNEALDPRRMLTSSVLVKNGKWPLVSVRSSKPVPKNKIFSVLSEIKKAKVDAPVKTGQILIKNVSGTNIDIVATNAATFYITGVQLEVGDTATPFEHRSYGDELARCQRYFYKTQTGGGVAEYRYAIFDGATGNYPTAFIEFPTPMRAVPSGTQTHNSYFYYNTGSGETNFSPSGGSDGSVGFTETYGRVRQNNITNSPGSSHAQKLGQWYCAGEFDAEL